MVNTLEDLKSDIKQLENLFDMLSMESKQQVLYENTQINNNEYISIPIKFININKGYPLLITLLKFDMFDECNKVLLNINNNEFSKLKNNQLEKFLSVLYKIIEKLPKKTLENMKGISKVLKNISFKDSKEYLKDIYENIFSKSYCIYNLDKTVVLEYTIRFFKVNDIDSAKYIINQLIERKLYGEYKENDLINLLLMSTYFNIHKELIHYEKVKYIINEKYPETMLINDMRNNKRTLSARYKTFSHLKPNLNRCNIEIAEKVYERISTLDMEVNDLYMNKHTKICDFDKENLFSKFVTIPIYNQSLTQEIRKLRVSVLWCKKCDTYSLNNKMFTDVRKQLNGNEQLNFKNMDELNLMSPLLMLGYHTKLNRKERESLLNEIVIPTLGVAKVINHIKFLININEKKKKKDYSKSITEWNYDIKMIKNRYKIG